jgi:hypothetical protein
MDAKVTLSFSEHIIDKAKDFADNHNISLSRLIEYLLSKVTDEHYSTLEAIPISPWVLELMKGEIEYNHKPSDAKVYSKSYFDSKANVVYVSEPAPKFKNSAKSKRATKPKK